jgi:DNA-3-methyladenine glycosylase
VPRPLRTALSGLAVDVAPTLLGATLTSTTSGSLVSARITEVEAYEGPDDPASHAFRGRTKRNAVMFGEPGFLYVYFVYGMHFCANITCGPDGRAAAVLLRAAEIRGADDPKLGSGPARLARTLGLTAMHTGLDLLDPTSPVRLRSIDPPAAYLAGPRVGVAAAHDRPWRFWLPDEPSVSQYRPHKKRSRRDGDNGSP